jgi:hypothetical protein
MGHGKMKKDACLKQNNCMPSNSARKLKPKDMPQAAHSEENIKYAHR